MYVTGIKTDIDQRNRIQSPEINSHICSPLIFNKCSRNTQCRKDILFNTWFGKLDIHTQKLQWTLSLLHMQKSKWIKDLNEKPEAISLLKKNKKFLDIGLGNDFLDMKPKAQTTKAKIYKWNYNKLKSFCKEKK